MHALRRVAPRRSPALGARRRRPPPRSRRARFHHRPLTRRRLTRPCTHPMYVLTRARSMSVHRPLRRCRPSPSPSFVALVFDSVALDVRPRARRHHSSSFRVVLTRVRSIVSSMSCSSTSRRSSVIVPRSTSFGVALSPALVRSLVRPRRRRRRRTTTTTTTRMTTCRSRNACESRYHTFCKSTFPVSDGYVIRNLDVVFASRERRAFYIRVGCQNAPRDVGQLRFARSLARALRSWCAKRRMKPSIQSPPSSTTT